MKAWSVYDSVVATDLDLEKMVSRVLPLLREGKVVSRFNVLVIGAGGVGFWTVVNLALSRCVTEIYVSDSDRVKEENLNRLPLNEMYLDLYKAEAVARWCEFTTITGRVRPVEIKPLENVSEEWLKRNARSYEVIVECTDDPKVARWVALLDHPRRVQVHYNGFDRITVAVNHPLHANSWSNSDRGRYEIVPSLSMPAMIAGSIAAFYALHPRLEKLSLAWQFNPLTGEVVKL